MLSQDEYNELRITVKIRAEQAYNNNIEDDVRVWKIIEKQIGNLTENSSDNIDFLIDLHNNVFSKHTLEKILENKSPTPDTDYSNDKDPTF